MGDHTKTLYPKGLSLSTLDSERDQDLIVKALAEVLELHKTEPSLSKQLSANRHFFINAPYPLDFLSGPVFDLDEPRLASCKDVVHRCVESFFGEEKAEDWLSNNRVNIIVRHYENYNKIKFHVDKLYFEEEIFGVVLQNTDPRGQGLELRKDPRDSKNVCVLEETPGTCFLMAGDARYEWHHGFFGKYFTRTSITIRWYKESEVEKIRQIRSEYPALLNEMLSGVAGVDSLRVVLVVNGRETEQRPVVLKPDQTANSLYESLLKTASNKFRCKARRLFWALTGEEILANNILMLIRSMTASESEIKDMHIAVSKGEDFVQMH